MDMVADTEATEGKWKKETQNFEDNRTEQI